MDDLKHCATGASIVPVDTADMLRHVATNVFSCGMARCEVVQTGTVVSFLSKGALINSSVFNAGQSEGIGFAQTVTDASMFSDAAPESHMNPTSENSILNRTYALCLCKLNNCLSSSKPHSMATSCTHFADVLRAFVAEVTVSDSVTS